MSWPKKAKRIVALSAVGAALTACIGTTGSEIVSFRAYAAGPANANLQPMTFSQNDFGWTITLTKAKLHIGAVYLNRSLPVSGGQERECFLPGVYVAQVLRGADIDVLSATPQELGERGTGTADPAVTGEVWLAGQRVDADDDPTPIAVVAGYATRGDESMHFEGRVTIGRDRIVASNDPARPGAHPLCKERIVTPIPIDITPRSSGALLVRVDPSGWFAHVDLSTLARVSPESDLRRFSEIPPFGEAETNFYGGLHSSTGVYAFEWMP